MNFLVRGFFFEVVEPFSWNDVTKSENKPAVEVDVSFPPVQADNNSVAPMTKLFMERIIPIPFPSLRQGYFPARLTLDCKDDPAL